MAAANRFAPKAGETIVRSLSVMLRQLAAPPVTGTIALQGAERQIESQ